MNRLNKALIVVFSALALGVVGVGLLFYNERQPAAGNGFDSQATKDKLETERVEGESKLTGSVSSTESFESEIPPEMDKRTTTLKRRALAALPNAGGSRDPYLQYQSNFAKALAGDADAQYEVSQALQRCSEVPRRDSTEGVLESTDPAVVAAVELRSANCKRLHDFVTEEEAIDGQRTWLALAAEQGQPLAVLTEQAIAGIDPRFDRHTLFTGAFESGKPEIYSLMTLYHSSPERFDEVEMSAWNFFRCNEDPTCSPEEYIEVLVEGGFDYQVLPVVDRIVEIRTALDAENWELLVPPK